MTLSYDRLEVISDPLFKVSALLAETACQGYAFERDFIEEDALAAMQDEATGLKLEVGDHISHPINEGRGNEVRQQHARAYRAVGNHEIPVATRVTSELVRVVSNMSDRYPALKQWQPTEAGYQLYRDDGDYISPHRDRSSDQLLAATINISGSTTVEIHQTVGDPMDYTQTEQIDEFTTSPGSIMFLRAPGFDQDDMLQTLHAVPPPSSSSRLVLNLRQRPTVLKNPQHTKWQ